jgi:acyl carrier protein
MTTTIDPAAIEDNVRQLVAQTLARDPAAIDPAARLIDDLGAESLDLLELVFRIERAYDIQITRGEMERAARGDLTDDQFAPAGVISPVGLDRLRELMPEARAHLQPGLRPFQILGLFSVRTFARIVAAKLA